MFKQVRSVSNHLFNGGNSYRSLEQIAQAVQTLTAIDEISYVGFEVPAANPVLGQFRRFTRQPSVYSSYNVLVEVLYATHLSEGMKRYVICKELCHALGSNEYNHTTTDAEVTALVESFALRSALQKVNQEIIREEFAAEVAAIELLCPVSVRRQYIAKGQNHHHDCCATYKLPAELCHMFFSEELIEITEALLES